MVKIGMLLHPERGVDAVFEEAKQADQQGFDSIWLGDHIMGHGYDGPDGPLDSLTLMTALGGVTKNTRLAWSILNPNFRYPAMLAKVLSTLDQITHGRVICTLGSGSVPAEHKAYDIPIQDDHDERVQHSREVVELLKELWTHPAPAKTTYNGKFVKATDLAFAPEPYQKPHPPIWLGGESDATIQNVIDYADGWIMLTRGSSTRLQEVLARPDWPKRPMTIVRMIRCFVAEDGDSAVAEAKKSFEADPVGKGGKAETLDEFIQREIVGTPDDCMRRIAELEATGQNYLRFAFDNEAQQERAAKLILPRVTNG
jgi:alkanesulfonate monooxygenase SsuD/methylene tetrahydromethanopterin reductase-like flavin-dependent oxidoreductase (luciferase family)